MAKNFPALYKILLFAALCCCCGCFDLTEEFFFHADSSGRYVLRFDMSRMMNFSGKMKQNWARQRDSLLALGQPLQVDSSFLALDRIPDSIRQLAKNTELLSRFKGRIVLDYERQSGAIEFSIDFKNLEDLRRVKTEWMAFQQFADSIQGKQQGPRAEETVLADATPTDFIGGQMPEFVFDGKKFSMTYPLMPEDDGTIREMLSDESPVGRNMLKSFKYNLALHLPKNIRSFEGEGFEQSGQTLRLATNFFEIASRPEGAIRLRAKMR